MAKLTGLKVDPLWETECIVSAQKRNKRFVLTHTGMVVGKEEINDTRLEDVAC